MDMEATVEFVGSSNNDATLVVKGKRTKRQRPLSPAGVAAIMTSSSSSASGDGGAGGGSGGDYGSFSSTTTTYESTEEEEDMANCLIMLAQGGDAQKQGEEHHQYHRGDKTERGSSRKFTEMATANASKIGFYIYECKTCNRTFPSFQALGGHRASHKKPKVAVEEKKLPPPQLPPSPPSPPQVTSYELEESGQLTHIKSSPQISLQLGSNRGFHSNNKAKIHECSICGSEFTSGQALGGHMRRHRASTNTNTHEVGMNDIDTSCNTTSVTTNTTTAVVEVKPRSILQLDLNLPAPEDDLRDTKFQFAATQTSLVLSAPALVDCHY